MHAELSSPQLMDLTLDRVEVPPVEAQIWLVDVDSGEVEISNSQMMLGGNGDLAIVAKPPVLVRECGALSFQAHTLVSRQSTFLGPIPACEH